MDVACTGTAVVDVVVGVSMTVGKPWDGMPLNQKNPPARRTKIPVRRAGRHFFLERGGAVGRVATGFFCMMVSAKVRCSIAAWKEEAKSSGDRKRSDRFFASA